MIRSFSQKLRAFREDRSGAAMLEFAISLPILLLILAVVIEGSRIAWTHQVAASGVRDASRFLARITQADICSNAGSLATFTDDFRDEATDIVAERVGSPDEQILPGGVNVVAITPSIRCVAGNGAFNVATVSIVEVRARIQIEFPFGGAFGIFGDPLEPLTTEIADESRVYGI